MKVKYKRSAKQILFGLSLKLKLAIVFTIFLFLLFLYFFVFSSNKKPDMFMNITTKSEKKNIKSIFVDIQGAINKPNVYKLSNGCRIFTLIKLAGGLKKNADISTINRAAILNDGEKIIIPYKNNNAKEISNYSNNSNVKVNINLAEKESLMELDGIGEKTAQKIIEYRNKNNGFKDISEIKNIDRIGEKTYLKLKDFICV